MGALSPTHWAILAGVVIILFGANRLPQMARGVGQSVRILRSEVRENKATASADDDTAAEPASTTSPVSQPELVPPEPR